MFGLKKSNNFLFINFRMIIYITIFIGVMSLVLTLLYKKDAKKQNNLQYIDDSLSKVQNLKLSFTNNAIFYENKDSNIVSINIIFKGGSALDYLSSNGVSYLLSESLLKGAGGLSFEEFNYLLEKYSIKVSVKVDRDQIVISFNTLNYYIKNAFSILDMILNEPNLDQKSIDLAKNEIFTEINVNQTSLNYKLFKKLRDNLYPNSKFYEDTTGSKTSLNTITPAILKDFKNKVITQSNIYIAVSGNISSDILFNNFNYIINKLPKGEPKLFNLEYQKPIINNKVINVPYPNGNQSSIFLVFNAPIYSTSDFLYAKILSAYLGGIPDSLLFNQLRNKQGLVYNVSSNLYRDSLTTFWLISLGASHQNADLAIEKVKSILLDLKNKKYIFSDVLVAKNWLLTSNLSNFSSNDSISYYINSLQFRDSNIFNALEKYKALDKTSQANINNLLDNIDISKILIIKSIDTKTKK